MTIQRELQDRLRSLGRWRRYERRLGAGVVLLGAVCCSAMTVFIVDSLLRLNATQRLFLLSLVVVALCCVLIRLLPRFLLSESMTELALQVEDHASSSSTLVTALQFSDGRHNGGSPDLVRESIARGEDAAGNINWPSPIDWSASMRRALFAVLAVGMAVLVTVAWPNHAHAFVQRLLFRNVDYPTKTRITGVSVNGDSVLSKNTFPPQPADGYAVENQPCEIRVQTAGVIPDTGLLYLKAGSNRQQLTLQPSADVPGEFVIRLDRLVTDCDYTIQIGDALSRPARIIRRRRPIVSVTYQVKPPLYAQPRTGPLVEFKSDNLRVLPGSQLRVVVSASKPLAECTVTIRQGDAKNRITLVPETNSATWATSADSESWNTIVDKTTLQLDALDKEGLRLPQPIQTEIQILRDEQPEGRVTSDHRAFVPDAKPLIYVLASDDYGLRSIVATVRIERPGDPQVREKAHTFFVAKDSAPRSLKQAFPFDLTPLKLAKNDRVQLRVTIRDARGSATGAIFECEPIVFDITDSEGVLNANSGFDAEVSKLLRELEAEQFKVLDGGNQ